MKNASLFHRTVLFLLFLMPWVAACAQQSLNSPERITMQVEGLTSATRDALMRDLQDSGDVRIAFACIPAGLIVFESRTAQSRVQLTDRSSTLLNARSAEQRSSTVDLSLAEAEAACAQARNR